MIENKANRDLQYGCFEWRQEISRWENADNWKEEYESNKEYHKARITMTVKIKNCVS